MTDRRVGKPRRHGFVGYGRGDGAGEGLRLRVGDERHRSDLAGAMADLAVVLEDREDVAIKGGRRGFAWSCGSVFETKQY